MYVVSLYSTSLEWCSCTTNQVPRYILCKYIYYTKVYNITPHISTPLTHHTSPNRRGRRSLDATPYPRRRSLPSAVHHTGLPPSRLGGEGTCFQANPDLPHRVAQTRSVQERRGPSCHGGPSGPASSAPGRRRERVVSNRLAIVAPTLPTYEYTDDLRLRVYSGHRGRPQEEGRGAPSIMCGGQAGVGPVAAQFQGPVLG